MKKSLLFRQKINRCALITALMMTAAAAPSLAVEANGDTLNIVSQKQEPGIIIGKVTDEKGDPLPGANIRITESNTGVQSKGDGTYSISLAPGIYTVTASFISYTSCPAGFCNKAQLSRRFLCLEVQRKNYGE